MPPAAELPMAQVPASGFSNAPHEIAERILDFLHNDFNGLCASSLIRRSWIPATRYHLFNRVIISQFRARGRIKENVSGFLALLLDTPHLTILNFIKTVILHITAPHVIREVVSAIAGAPGLINVLFVDYTPIDASSSVSWISQCLPNIQQFSYDTVHVFAEDSFSLVASFAHLRCLSIYTGILTAFTFPAHRLSVEPFLRLRTLRLQLRDSEQLLQWLLDSCPNMAVETFDLRILSISHR